MRHVDFGSQLVVIDLGYSKYNANFTYFLFYFRFTPQFIQSLYQKHDYNRDGTLQFDGFVHSVILIQVRSDSIVFELILHETNLYMFSV